MPREQMAVKFSAAQNKQLEDALVTHYKLDYAPKISKELHVSKESYTRFINKTMRARTPYESDKNFAEFKADDFRFDVLGSKIVFKMMPTREISLLEILDKPNGLTESVKLEDSGGESVSFDSYLKAEEEIISRFLKHITLEVT